MTTLLDALMLGRVPAVLAPFRGAPNPYAARKWHRSALRTRDIERGRKALGR